MELYALYAFRREKYFSSGQPGPCQISRGHHGVSCEGFCWSWSILL